MTMYAALGSCSGEPHVSGTRGYLMEPAPYLAVVVGVGAVAQVIAWHLRMPSILLLLLVGFGLGQLVDPEQVLGRDVLFGGVTIAVGIILFEGALSLRYRQFLEVGGPVLRLIFVTPMIAWVLITLTAMALGYQWELALLVGAILIVTGPTVIAPILRMLRPTRRVASLLRWEGIVVDPIGAMLAVIVYQGVLAGSVDSALSAILLNLGRTVLVAAVIAIGLGFVLEQLHRRRVIPDFLQGITFLAGAITAMVGSNALQPESGLLTVTLLGIYLGNQPNLHLEHVAEFKEHLQVLFVGGLFVVLAGRVSPEQVVAVAPRALVFLVILVLLVRPLSVFAGLAGSEATRAEKVLLAGMAPRGIVAAAVVSIFGLEFANAAERASGERAGDLQRLAEEASALVPLVFLVIVGTVAIYGLGVGRLAERLGLAAQKPQGIIFVGGQRWIVQAASLLEEAKVPVVVVAREFSKLNAARMAGLNTVTANILSDYAVKEMDLAGIGSLIACTDQDEVNATAAREFAHVLGRAGVYQLRRAEAEDRTSDKRREPAAHLTARIAFAPATTSADLARKAADGMVVKKTKLTAEFSLADFRERYPDAVVMFILRRAQVQVVTEETKLPDKDVAIVALVSSGSTAQRATA